MIFAMASLLRVSIEYPSKRFAYSKAMRLGQKLPNDRTAIRRLKDFPVPIFDKIEFGPSTHGGHVGVNFQNTFVQGRNELQLGIAGLFTFAICIPADSIAMGKR